MITNCKMKWDEELHSFIFHTYENSTASIDFLGDMIGTLEHLKSFIIKEERRQYEDRSIKDFGKLPTAYKVEGTLINTWIDGKIYKEETK